jgi:glycosyltransferase involved in cell wall biosynthesis
MICFSHDWTGDPLSKTHLMRELARDNRILWVNSIGYRTPSLGSKNDLRRVVQKLKAAAAPVREVEPNIFVLNPLVVPAWGFPAVRAFNAKFLRWQVRRAMRDLRFRKPINWVFNPAAGAVAGTLGEDRIIYYCVDEYTAFRGVNREQLAAVERDVIAKADLVVVSAEKLLHAKRPPHAQAVLVRHGVDYRHFRTALDAATVVPDEIARLPRPVIGYFGLIAEDWVDVPLLVHLARHFRHGSLVMLGKATMDVSLLAAEPNVHLLGRKPYSSLPAYCKGFDVAVIPFPVTEVTLNANPLKAREYLAAGLPVVSTRIPEVEVLGCCAVADGNAQFATTVEKALAQPGVRAERSRGMATESWSARLQEIRTHFENAISRKGVR